MRDNNFRIVTLRWITDIVCLSVILATITYFADEVVNLIILNNKQEMIIFGIIIIGAPCALILSTVSLFINKKTRDIFYLCISSVSAIWAIMIVGIVLKGMI